MSLRWSDRLYAALSPTGLNAAVWAPGWSAQPAERASLPCSPSTSGPRWAPALASLREWLGGRSARRGGLRVVLSNHFVRYLVLPWHDGMTGTAEREALARHLLRETYGEIAEGWHVKLAPCAFGAPALVCAVDRELIAALHGAAEGASLRLDAVQPMLMPAFNQFRRELAGDACLLVLEPGCLGCAVVRGGHWNAVQVSRVGSGWNEALVERQIAVHGLAADMPVYLFDASGRAEPLRDGQAYRALRPPAARRADPALALFAHAT
ncbi:hypothetical protein [uncultured Piscinibacter sp.]|uniref:hypothetical protein n=1 Tax=uncultured Piscinibacter sp. TaxID=1131835 RepID=UPI0026100A9E|nr:hypothetical protein [uncultured Piscinibacter sp.]